MAQGGYTGVMDLPADNFIYLDFEVQSASA